MLSRMALPTYDFCVAHLTNCYPTCENVSPYSTNNVFICFLSIVVLYPEDGEIYSTSLLFFNIFIIN